MECSTQRRDKRAVDALREIKVTYDVFDYADGSVLFEMGNTRVLCAVNLNHGVPSFLKGKGAGWLTAEYAMLPASTATRLQRQTSSFKPNGRSVEISRLIGRSLRSIVNFNALGERTIMIDCDVINADGGTRTASITGACIALRVAVERWLAQGIISKNILNDTVGAISVGYRNGTALLDVDFAEDCKLDADFNFVLTGSGKVVEIQGASETDPIAWDAFEQVRTVAQQGIAKLFEQCDTYTMPAVKKITKQPASAHAPKKHINKTALFSLKNRLNKTV